MKESIQEMSPTARKFITLEIGKALSRHRLPWNSPVRDDLESRAEVVGSREYAVASVMTTAGALASTIVSNN